MAFADFDGDGDLDLVLRSEDDRTDELYLNDGAGRFVLDGMPADADVEVWAEGNATGAWGAQVSTPAGERLALVYVPAAY